MKDIGMLSELCLENGDIVELVSEGKFSGEQYILQNDIELKAIDDSNYWTYDIDTSISDVVFKVISRANNKKVELTWGELTNAQKGELLLALYNKETIEFYGIAFGSFGWHKMGSTTFQDDTKYRIKQKRIITEDMKIGYTDGFEAAIEMGEFIYQLFSKKK